MGRDEVALYDVNIDVRAATRDVGVFITPIEMLLVCWAIGLDLTALLFLGSCERADSTFEG